MERIVALIAVASLGIVGCSGSSPPKAFPGTATDKARELVRLQKREGLPPGNAKQIALGYSTIGDGFCADKDPKKRKLSLGADNLSRREQKQAIRNANLIVEVYCPWLSRFPG
jgi:hypothetical protein